jgi:hypothetical protein
MMEDGGTAARIKQEIDSCCSPSPTSSNNNVSILSFGSSGQEPVSLLSAVSRSIILQRQRIIRFQMDYKCGSDTMINSEQPSPGSPDRQFCSSTTSAIGEFGNDSNIQDAVKEELPR